MHVKVDNYEAIDCTISMPLVGPWSAVVTANGPSAFSGALSISIADWIVFRGTVKRAGVVGARSQAWITAGAARMNEQIDGKTYADAPARIPISEILGGVGESLSSLSDAALLETKFAHWIRARNPARRELEILLARLGATWRHLPDGTVWIGVEDWPASQLTKGYVIGLEDKTGNKMTIACDAPTVLPGEVFEGQRVIGVEHKLAGSKLRTTVQFL